MDHFNDISGERGAGIGPVILPSSFQGSPRNMRERSISRCNGNCCSITVKWSTRPCSTRFQLETESIPYRHNKKMDKVFGRSLRKKKCTNAFVCTIEFQKRGLPHAHFLIKPHDEDVIDSPEKKMIGILLPKSLIQQSSQYCKRLVWNFEQRTVYMEENGPTHTSFYHSPLYRRR